MKNLTPDEWEKLNSFWHQMVMDHIHLAFQNPEKSFYWFCVDERNHTFKNKKWSEGWGLKAI